MEELPLAELPRRFPQLDARGVERAFWMDTGGVLFAQDIVAGYKSPAFKSTIQADHFYDGFTLPDYMK